MWAVYNTVRYFVAFSIYTARDRQIALLAFGTAAALSFASLMLSLLLSFFAPHLGWKHRSRSSYTRFQVLLTYTASFLILGPAVGNVVFVALWRDSSDPGLSIHGRCHWDIDVLWTGTGFECDVNHSVSWGSWLAGSVIRLLLTVGVIVSLRHSSLLQSVTYSSQGRISRCIVQLSCHQDAFSPPQRANPLPLRLLQLCRWRAQHSFVQKFSHHGLHGHHARIRLSSCRTALLRLGQRLYPRKRHLRCQLFQASQTATIQVPRQRGASVI